MGPEDAPSTASTAEDTSASSTTESGSVEESPAESSQDGTAQEGTLFCIVFYIQLRFTQMINMDHDIRLFRFFSFK